MQDCKQHIASFLAAVLLVGTVVVPVVHQIGHAIEMQHVKEAIHTHPAYDALLDANQHGLLHTHINCILCSSQSTHFFFASNAQKAIPDHDVYFVIPNEVHIPAAQQRALSVRGSPFHTGV
ncbi:MAG: hypothetical protein AB8G77_28110 [Rhodothermales bacterium]